MLGWRRIWTMLFLVVGCIGSGLGHAHADTAPQVDVVLLVDQSGSMGGAPFGMPSSVVEIQQACGLRPR